MATKKYEIHHNGSRPFFVEVTGKKVSVTKNMNTFKLVDGKFVDIEKPVKDLFTVNADEIFVGKKSPNGGYDGLTPSKAVGNSILLKVGDKYTYIGSEIYTFSPVKGDTILKYYSNIGNNDVPYPYAIGKTHVYIMLDKVAVEKSYFDMKDDIYEQFYYDHRIHMCLVGNPKSNLCKNKEEYTARIAEFNEKKMKLKIHHTVR
jgi:hypothetical protein